MEVSALQATGRHPYPFEKASYTITSLFSFGSVVYCCMLGLLRKPRLRKNSIGGHGPGCRSWKLVTLYKTTASRTIQSFEGSKPNARPGIGTSLAFPQEAGPLITSTWISTDTAYEPQQGRQHLALSIMIICRVVTLGCICVILDCPCFLLDAGFGLGSV